MPAVLATESTPDGPMIRRLLDRGRAAAHRRRNRGAHLPAAGESHRATRRRCLGPVRLRRRHVRVRGSAQLDRRLLQVSVVPAAARRVQHHPRRRAGLAESDDHPLRHATAASSTTMARSGSSSGRASMRACRRSDSAWPVTAGDCRSAEAALLSALRLDHLRTDLRLADPGVSERASPSHRRREDAGMRARAGAAPDGRCRERSSRISPRRLDDRARDRPGPGLPRGGAGHRPALGRSRPRPVCGRSLPTRSSPGGTNANFCELNRFRPAGERERRDRLLHQSSDPRLRRALAGGEHRRPGGDGGDGASPTAAGARSSSARSPSNSASTAWRRPPSRSPVPASCRPRSIRARCPSSRAAGRSAVSSNWSRAAWPPATYYETTGWRGVIQGDEPPSAPELFPSRAGMVFPVYHVFADLAEWKDGTIISSRSSNPLAVETLAMADDGMLHLLVANLTPEPQTVTIDALSGTEVTRAAAERRDGRVGRV